MIVIAQDRTFSGPEKLVRRWFESWHGPDRGLGGLAVFGCTLPGVAGGPGRRADVLVWTPGYCAVVEIAGLRRSQSGVLDTAERWRIGSAPADLDLPVASLTPDVRAAQTATGLRARLTRAGLPDLVGELAVLVTAPGSAVTHPEPLEPAGVGVVVAGSADPEAVERYFRRQDGAARWDVAALSAVFAELGLGELLPAADLLEREGFAAGTEISAAEVAAQGVVTPLAEPPSERGGVTRADPEDSDGRTPGTVPHDDRPSERAVGMGTPSDETNGAGAAAVNAQDPQPISRLTPEAVDPASPPTAQPTPGEAGRTGADNPAPVTHPRAADSGSAGADAPGPEPAEPGRARADHSEPVYVADDELEPDDPRRAEAAVPERVPAMAAVGARPPWLAPIPPLPDRPRRRAGTRRSEPSAITEVDAPRSAPVEAEPVEAPRPPVPEPPRTGTDHASARRADPAAVLRTPAPTFTPEEPRPAPEPPAAPLPRSRGVRLTKPATPHPDPRSARYVTPPQPARPVPPPPPPAQEPLRTAQHPPRRYDYDTESRPLPPRQHYSPPPSRGQRLRTAFDTESWPRFRVGGTAVVLALAALVAVFFVVVHVARENRPALADYAAMCDKPEPFTGAAQPKPGPVGVYAAGDLNAVSPPNDPALPRATRPEDVQWVACATRTGVGAPVADCRYQDGSELTLIQGRYRLTVYEASTGATVHRADVPGDWFAPGTIPITDPCAATAGAAPDQPGQRFGRPAPDQLRQFLTDAARTRGLPS